MRVRYNYSNDSEFLDIICREKLQEQFIKITVLDWFERPIKEVQGIVTGGNLNLAGNSSMRRTCNLTVYVEDEYLEVTNVDNLFSINKKIYLEIGYKNTTQQYLEHEIIWFPQGVFVIINPSISHSSSGTTISLQCKDKMCLLNGDVGGTIPASTQFDEYETIDENGEWILTKPTIIQIIRELVNHFGGEQLGKIIISDLDSRIKKVMKWIGDTPIYLINNDGNYILTTDYNDTTTADEYHTFEYGADIGYVYADFTYPGELIGDAGNTVTDILDKIKNMLGNYEYFYDIDGNFVWQEIKNFLNTTQATVVDRLENGEYVINPPEYLLDMSKGKAIYQFNNGNLITSYTNTPQYNMIKNDFIVWGIRENANGNSVPIRYHLSIDTRPKVGNIYECFFYEDPDDKLIKAKMPIKFTNKTELDKIAGAAGVFYMTEDDKKIYKWEDKAFQEINISLVKVKTTDWRSELYLQGVQAEPFGTKSNYYYTELMNEWPKLYNMQAKTEIINGEEVYIGDFYPEVARAMEDIDYYLDIIDSSANISKFSVSNIGRRTKVVSDNDVNCVFEPDVPDFILIELGTEETSSLREEAQKKGQNFIQVETSIYELLTQGGMANSAYHRVRELLYQYTSYNESITIQSIPVYFLQPNTRIEVRDIESNIFGDYMISTISIPLGTSNSMSISATRALERI